MKNKIITIGFVAILLVVFVVNIVTTDEAVSTSERRKLAQFPTITTDKLLEGKISDEFEKYAMDQFVERDTLRGLKSFISTNIFRQKDNNKLFLRNNEIYKIEYPMKTNNIRKSAKVINELYKKYMQNMNVYYAIIPDKNNYLEDDTYLKMNYTEIEGIMQDALKETNMQYIPIEDCLTLSDYYRTDTHWKQENLQKVVNRIEASMNVENSKDTNYSEKYTKQELGDFYGVYYGQLGMPVQPDKINILTNDTLNQCTAYNVEKDVYGDVYGIENWNTLSDKYDVFLSGAVTVITIDNPNAKTDKELLLFRDSFGSSIAPLLVENYSKITLIDIRYLASQFVEEYINFENQDVLFLYSSLVLNQNILK